MYYVRHHNVPSSIYLNTDQALNVIIYYVDQYNFSWNTETKEYKSGASTDPNVWRFGSHLHIGGQYYDTVQTSASVPAQISVQTLNTQDISSFKAWYSPIAHVYIKNVSWTSYF